MAYHFAFAWFFGINGFLYVLYTFVSGEWRHLFGDDLERLAHLLGQ
jgi:thiosulfate reductase cytochrome b subunit